MTACFAAHHILGIIFWHGEESLIQKCVVDSIDEIRPIRFLGCQP